MDPAPPVSPPENTPDQDTPTYTHTRTGNVARKPKLVRDRLNNMLLDGVPFLKIIENLGDDGKDLNEDIIGRWKAGGYKDWLSDLERKEALTTTRDAALDLIKDKPAPSVQEAARTVVAAQLYELLLSFNPTTFAEALAEKPELYFRLVGALARLSEGEAVCAHRRAQESLLASKLRPGEPVPEKKLLSEEALKSIAHQTKLL
jgi:hypothetical protein